jgi:hypothetical protein
MLFGMEIGYAEDMMGSGLYVHEPERDGQMRLRREFLHRPDPSH